MEIPVQKNLFRIRTIAHGAGTEMETSGQHPITLVTAYFDLGRKQTKHAGNPYPGWIRNFLPFVRWPLVIFCDEQSLDMLKEMRGDKLAVWHVMRLEEFFVYKYWSLLKNLETDGGLAAEYGLVWHEKHNFLRRALSENPFDSEMFFWCDIGLFRFRQDASLWRLPLRHIRLYEDVEWPSLRACRALPQDKVILESVRNDLGIWEGCFGGAIEPMRKWCDAYYQNLEHRSRNEAFPLTENLPMRFLRNRLPELVHLVPPHIASPPLPVGFLISLMIGRGTLRMVWYLLKGERWKYLRRAFNPGFGR